MEFDLRQAIESLDQEEVFNIANQARPASDYLGNTILPNRNMETYDVEGGNMTIRTTMAGLSGMDSRYTEGGAAESSDFTGKTGKLTIHAELSEKMLRELQAKLLRLTARRMDNTQLVQETGLNFVNKIIVQALLDREEWLKWQGITTGQLNWQFNGKVLKADYGIPAGNFLPARTGNFRYGGSSSMLWNDIWLMQEKLQWQVLAYLIHPTLLRDIMANPTVNQLEFISQNLVTGQFTFRRRIADGTGGSTRLSTDPRDTITLTAYNKEAEIFDLVTPGKTKKVPFLTPGAFIAIGAQTNNSVFRVGDGSTEPPASPIELGYGHVAPTTEGGGNPGRWTRLRVHPDKPWGMESDGVENFIPVIEAPDRLVIGSSQVGA